MLFYPMNSNTADYLLQSCLNKIKTGSAQQNNSLSIGAGTKTGVFTSENAKQGHKAGVFTLEIRKAGS